MAAVSTHSKHLFPSRRGTNSNELWKSDGTASGTVMVKDINSGSSSSSLLAHSHWSTPSISSHDGTNGSELWKSDGTASGTVMVKDIYNGSTTVIKLTAVGNTLYFRADDGTNGDELWKSDGMITVMVKDIKAEVAVVLPLTSQPLVAPSISEPMTEPTDTNCGRAMELPQVR